MHSILLIKKCVRQPGIEPGSIAWKATMLTFTPPTLHGGPCKNVHIIALLLTVNIFSTCIHKIQESGAVKPL